jgi:hypothetical protein
VKSSKKHLKKRRQRIEGKYFSRGIKIDSKLDIISEVDEVDKDELNESESEYEIVSDEDDEGEESK